MKAEGLERLMLRPTEAAEMLGVCRALAYRWAQNGTIPVVRVGRSVRIPKDSLLAWIAARTQQPTAHRDAK